MNFNINPSFLYDNDSRGSTKTEEELKKLTLEEDLSELKRAQYILMKGQQLQKWAIYSALHKLLLEPDAFLILLPIVKEELTSSQDAEMQEEAAKSLQKLLIHKLTNEQATQLLQITYVFLKEWAKVFSLIITNYPVNLDQVFTLTLALSEPDQTTISRLISAKMIGYIAEAIGDKVKPLLERAKALCQDNEFEVREAMAHERLYKSVSDEIIKHYLFANILELVYDSSLNVRKEAIKMFFAIQSKLQEQERQKWVIKYFFEFLSSQNEEIVKTISEICGQTFEKIYDLFQEQQVIQFISILRQYSESRNEEIRKNFAFNIVGVMHILDGRHIEYIIESYIDSLLRDQYKEVRSILSASFHEMIHIIGPQKAQKYLSVPFKELIQEGNLDLIKIILLKLDQILEGFQSLKTDQIECKQATVTYMLSQNFIKKEHNEEFFIYLVNLLSSLLQQHKWDMISLLLDNFEICQPYFQDCDIFNKLMPVLKQCLQNGCMKSRELACFNIAKYSYYLNESQKRLEILLWMHDNCFISGNYQMRMNYIFFLVGIAQYCSRKFFASHKFIKVLDVKMTLARNLYQIRMAIDDQDEHQLQNFKNSIQKLLSTKKRILVDLVKQSEELVQRYASNFENLKSKTQEKDHLKESIEEKRISQEMKNLRAEVNQIDLLDPIPLSPFLLDFIKKVKNYRQMYYQQYKKRHSLIGTKVIATGAAANASLTQKISQNVNKMNNQSKKQQETKPRSRQKSVVLIGNEINEQQKKNSLPHSELKSGLSSERGQNKKTTTPKIASQFKPKKPNEQQYQPTITPSKLKKK